DWITANITRIKASTAARASVAALHDDSRAMTLVAKTPALSGGATLSALSARGAVAPQASSSANVTGAAPAGFSQMEAQASAFSEGPEAPQTSQYVTLGPKPNLPIVVNNLPASFSPWSPEDQYQMSKWNYYASDVFHVYTTPTGSFAWGDN